MIDDRLECSSVCATVVLHFPSENVIERLARMADNIGYLILVDNGCDADTREALVARMREHPCEWIFNDGNFGVARALNQAAKRASERGFQWLLTFDQDSEPHEGMLEALLDVFSTLNDPGCIAIIAPVIEQVGIKRVASYLRPRFSLFYQRSECKHRVLEGVTLVLTSGALTNLEILHKLGGFRSDFFVDYVDTEYCLRCLDQGFRIVAACEAKLYHRLGNRVERRIGPLHFYPTFHSPIRWYYISRNRVPMLRMYALKFPYWLSFEIVSSLNNLLRMLLFEDHRLRKLKAIFYGTLAGLRGQMGKIFSEHEAKLVD